MNKKKETSKIVITVFSVKELSLRERLRILRKFFPSYYTGKNNFNKGHLLRFNNAMGFSDVEWQVSIDSCNRICPKINSNDDYLSPYSLFMGGMYFLNKPNEIGSFVVDNTREYHQDKKYSYNTLEMALKLQNYLYRFVPDIRIEIKIQPQFKISEREFLLSNFLTCLAENEIVDNECAVAHPTKDKDKEYIISIFKSLGAEDISFEQFYCKTCAEYHPDRPYHTELDFNYWQYRL